VVISSLHVATRQARRELSAPQNPRASYDAAPSRSGYRGVYHIPFAELVGHGRLSVAGSSGAHQRSSEILGVFGGETQRCGEYARLIFTPRVKRIEAIVDEFLKVNYCVLAARQFHNTGSVSRGDFSRQRAFQRANRSE
jgi:hypothetical protein